MRRRGTNRHWRRWRAGRCSLNEPPARPGPTTSAAVPVSATLLLASTIHLRATRIGRKAWCAMLEISVSVPMRKAMTWSRWMESVLVAQASGMQPRSRARPISVAIMIGRRSRRSTTAPPCRPIRSGGSELTAVSTRICAGVASSVTIAVSGGARQAIRAPTCVMASLAQSFGKSACRHKPASFVTGGIALLVPRPARHLPWCRECSLPGGCETDTERAASVLPQPVHPSLLLFMYRLLRRSRQARARHASIRSFRLCSPPFPASAWLERIGAHTVISTG